MPTKDLEKIVYYESYTVVNGCNTGLPIKHLLTEEEYFKGARFSPTRKHGAFRRRPEQVHRPDRREAIKELLKRTDIEALSLDLRRAAREETSQLKRQDALKRLRTIEAFRETRISQKTVRV